MFGQQTINGRIIVSDDELKRMIERLKKNAGIASDFTQSVCDQQRACLEELLEARPELRTFRERAAKVKKARQERYLKEKAARLGVTVDSLRTPPVVPPKTLVPDDPTTPRIPTSPFPPQAFTAVAVPTGQTVSFLTVNVPVNLDPPSKPKFPFWDLRRDLPTSH